MDLQEAQRMALGKMLHLKTNSDADERRIDSVPQWKVLVYDKACQDIIAPIMKVCLFETHLLLP
jgi:hypothetical protein